MVNVQLYGGGRTSSFATVAKCYLYPNTWSDSSDVDSGSVSAEAARDLFEQLLDSGTIDGYEVYQKDLNSYPALSGSFVGRDFADWANDNNPDLADEQGCHMLVGEDIEYAGGSDTSYYQGFSDYPSDFNFSKNPNHSAFEYGITMFTGLSNQEGSSHSNSRVRNFVMQECLHTFSSENYWYPDANILDCGSHDTQYSMPDEHMLGVVWDNGPYGANSITPFLTSHASDADDGYTIPQEDLAECGPCDNVGEWEGAYYDQITDCTDQAVEATVEGL